MRTNLAPPPASTRRALLAGSTALAAAGLLPGACPGVAAAADALEFNSPYNFINIERSGSVVTFNYSLVAGRMSAIDLERPAYQVVAYTRYYHVGDLLRPNPRQVLMAGLGAGGFNRLFNLVHPEARLVSVEIDPMILALAQEHAAFRTGANNEVVVDDARIYLRRSKETFDWIVLDAFDKDAQIPVHLTTREFYKILMGRLAPDGVLLVNLHQGTRFFASHVLTIRTVFPDVVLLPVEGRGNLVLAATRPPARPIREGLATLDPAGELAARYREHGVDLAEIAASAVLEPDYIGPVQQAGVVLTDDFAPVETLDRERVPAILPPGRGRG